MKNIDKIKAMTTWELAEFIKSVADNVTKITVCENECTKCECSDSYCVSQVADWLISEVENEKN